MERIGISPAGVCEDNQNGQLQRAGETRQFMCAYVL